MNKRTIAALVPLAAVALLATGCSGGSTSSTSGDNSSGATLTIESWRSEDAALWQDQIIPAFNKAHPDIAVQFTPTKNTEYNAALESRLAGGTAGDLITCRPFDLSAALNAKGYFAPLTDQAGLENFDDLALSAWRADDGTQYCVPIASVIHGFYYNKDAFDELSIAEPTTVAEFQAAMKTLKDSGKYTPLAWGTGDTWIAYETSYSNIGPTYWKGEQGRQGLLDKSKKFTDPEFVAAWDALNAWQPYFPDGYEGITYTDTQQLFTLGKAAIFPGGSWEITGFESAPFTVGIFAPPVVNSGDQCYISDHVDLGIGLNAASPNKEAAGVFLEWLTTSEFANIYANALPGFFPLTTQPVTIDNATAQEFMGFRDNCDSTVRLVAQKLSAGEPNTDTALGTLTAEMWNGRLKPTEVATQVQQGLDSWY